MVRCDKCGNKVADGKKYCVICGELMENPQICIEDEEPMRRPGCGIGVKIFL